MNKIAIVVGHTKLRPGAKGIDIPSEYEYNSKVAKFLDDICDIYYYGSYNLGYKAMVKANAAKMNKKDYDLVLELHYNASVPQANGCEVFYYFNNSEGKKLATTLSADLSKYFGRKNRGAKAMAKKSQRGFWALYYPKATTLLLEPFFGSNQNDADKFRESEKLYANRIRCFLESNNLI